jgi:hypothetical protein
MCVAGREGGVGGVHLIEITTHCLAVFPADLHISRHANSPAHFLTYIPSPSPPICSQRIKKEFEKSGVQLPVLPYIILCLYCTVKKKNMSRQNVNNPRIQSKLFQ